LSQADLAEKAGISITFLSDIERGNKWPYPDTLSNLAQALDAPVYELFKLQDDVSDETKSILRQFSEDVSRIMSQSLETVYKKYNVL
jgi:transcriptional regulator with XRE-family HTH domain